ncbi:MAG TPA: hypothetical protein VFN23_01610 [Ktedonobacteraceae bacterium]|nr:hypothetical protein [Ktedonobacteraceae bacterium]
MDICLIMDNPETPHHPVLGVALQKLKARHSVRLLDVVGLKDEEAIALEQGFPQSDLYLLKSHAPQALAVAHYLEQHGARVINSWASSLACQDRVLMADMMKQADLPWPATTHVTTLAQLFAGQAQQANLQFPLIIKSHYSHRGDLVSKVDSLEELHDLLPEWSEEPIVFQEFVPGDGWDIKLWVIGSEIYAARRRTPLEADASKEDIPLTSEELPAEWARITRTIGEKFQLYLYGIDLLETVRGPMIVDVNGFPGFRGVPRADEALVELVERFNPEGKQTNA